MSQPKKKVLGVRPTMHRAQIKDERPTSVSTPHITLTDTRFGTVQNGQRPAACSVSVAHIDLELGPDRQEARPP